ncbi:unnamed protein product [Symbiodinium sp. CCMP2592]|nr:unnamed protein product [Symbiodinium sp. CCMP2592]
MGIAGLAEHYNDLLVGSRLATVEGEDTWPPATTHGADVIQLNSGGAEEDRPFFTHAITMEQATQNLAAVRGFLQGEAYQLCGRALIEVLRWYNGGGILAQESQEEVPPGQEEWPTTGGATGPTQLDHEDPGDAERDAYLDLHLQQQFEAGQAAQEQAHDDSDDQATLLLAAHWQEAETHTQDFGAVTYQEMEAQQAAGSATQAGAAREEDELEAMADYALPTGRRRLTSSPTDKPTPASSPESDSSD